jgi:tetratricopeptide (TPR) repeat protein
MLRLWVLAVAVSASMLGLTGSGRADAAADQAWKECRSGDQDVRFAGCSKIIVAKGYGDRKQLGDALDGRCWALHAKQQFREAISDCKAAIALFPRHFYAFNNLGTALLGLGDTSNAIAAFNASIAINPRFVRPYIKRGQAYQALGRRDLALQDYQQALQLNGTNTEALAALRSLETQVPASVAATKPPAVVNGPNKSPEFEWGFISTKSQSNPSVRRRAILIANDDYKQIDKLTGPKNDVEATSSVLKEIGFETVLLRNPTRNEIISAISSANFKQERGSLLLLYYSGHAAEINGENTVLLTGYNPVKGTDPEQSVTLKTLLDALAEADFDKTLVAFDACRNSVKMVTAAASQDTPNSNVTVVRSFRGMKISSVELQSLRRKEYSILFSTSAGEFAIDSLSDGLSPFTKSFISALRRESSFIPAMVLTKRITEEATSNEQSPTIEIKWNSDVTFARTLKSTNSAFYELNEPLKLSVKDDARLAVLKTLTEKKWSGGSQRSILTLGERELGDCVNSSAFVWTSSILQISFCALPQLGFSSSDTQSLTFSSSESVYNSGSYFDAEWNVDLDFDGRPENFRAERRNADFAFIVKSRTQEFEFRGLVGSNISFVGAHDFNRDGVLDLLLEIGPAEGFSGRELVILDGKSIVGGLQAVRHCDRGTTLCEAESALASQMKGSIFGHQLQEGYYSHDIFQIVLFMDWNVKDWQLMDDGRLDYVTYGATWQNEKSVGDDSQIAKSVVFNKGEQRFSVNYHGVIPRISARPVLETLQAVSRARSFPN